MDEIEDIDIVFNKPLLKAIALGVRIDWVKYVNKIVDKKVDLK
jgi:hypothetical protein